MRLRRLTSLRFVAALAVFCFHATPYFHGATRDLLDGIFGPGRSGVTFFFVLSGFVLMWSFDSGSSAQYFYRRRFARIYPVYVVTLALASILWLIRDPSGLRGGALTPLLLQAWVPDSSSYFAINVPAWSLSVEAFFYLIFPLVVLALRRLTTVWLWAMCAMMVSLSSGIAAIASLSVGPTDLSSNTFGVWFAVYCPFCRLPEFVLGVVLALLLRRRSVPKVPFVLTSVLCLGVWATSSAWPSVYTVAAICMVPFGLLIVAAAQRDVSGSSGILTSRVAVAGGEISYCFYLVHHIFIIRLVQPRFAELGFSGWPAFGVTLGVSLLAAWVLHRLVEVPMYYRLRGKNRDSRGAAAGLVP